MATATGMRNFLRMLGGTLGLTICSSIINNIVRQRLDPILASEVVDHVTSDPTTLSQLGLSDSQKLLITQAYGASPFLLFDCAFHLVTRS